MIVHKMKICIMKSRFFTRAKTGLCFFLFGIIFCIAGCGTHKQQILQDSASTSSVVIPVSPTTTTIFQQPEVPIKPEGIHHTVERGETLWRIAKVYGVSVKALSHANKLTDISRIEVGQQLLIPGATEKKDFPKKKPTFSKPIVSETNFIWPVEGTIVSEFGAFIDGGKDKGIEIGSPVGTDVHASKSGVVSFIHERVKGFGNVIIVDHSDNYQTVYAYNDSICVKEGDYVQQGQKIATVGKNGRNSTAALHFEIRKNSRPLDPTDFLN
jgi:murein DD-endopeptidase MepM/ murein hydrolase activator NlpD